MLLASIGGRIWANEPPTIIYEDRLPHHVTNDDDMVSCIVNGQIFHALKDDGIQSKTVAIDHPAIACNQRIGRRGSPVALASQLLSKNSALPSASTKLAKTFESSA